MFLINTLLMHLLRKPPPMKLTVGVTSMKSWWHWTIPESRSRQGPWAWMETPYWVDDLTKTQFYIQTYSWFGCLFVSEEPQTQVESEQGSFVSPCLRLWNYGKETPTELETWQRCNSKLISMIVYVRGTSHPSWVWTRELCQSLFLNSKIVTIEIDQDR